MTETRPVQVREVGSLEEIRAIEALFVDLWRTSVDQPPVNADILRALAHTGCYVAGAYEGDRLIGASAGFLGGADGDLHLHSHITGVAPDAQGRHVGRALKLHQRGWCLERGIAVVTWTFDPLIRRNGWFNLQRLGAEIVGFERDFYGEMRDGVNVGDHSDRCLVRWDLPAAGERPPVPADAAPPALAVGNRGEPVVLAVGADGGARRCAVPADAVALRRDDPALAQAWRAAFRDTFGAAVDGGHRVVGMTADGEYVLAR
ncbi:MAG TPA: GNAT family N-acetyltransferase [Acidimicrobiales bacterium]|nr:GNAT family N-acetyltransferase [Acidimicrobiales bacterium]